MGVLPILSRGQNYVPIIKVAKNCVWSKTVRKVVDDCAIVVLITLLILMRNQDTSNAFNLLTIIKVYFHVSSKGFATTLFSTILIALLILFLFP